ncbi:MAG: type II toxin-antitoxin system VapC family toxin [Rhodospirillaceae bacterium]|nr:type II toxin-antitoxin system VapC family toxin [Rhodospirillaceae bacterium]
MSGLVLDCSVAVSWCFEDEAAPEIDALLETVRDEGAIVPTLWHLEVANVLVMAERRGRLSAADTAARLHLLGELPVDTDDGTAHRAWAETIALARAQHLTAYDAAYLELAMRKGLPLATKDGDLAAAARRSGVKTLPA